MDLKKEFRKYRWFFTSSDSLVVGGKSAVQNDELLSAITSMKDDLIVMHTSEPGSPFCAIIKSKSKVLHEDIEECAIFTGCFSRAWRVGKDKTRVDVFSSNQLHKNSDMKSGTWGVYGKVKSLTVSLRLALTKQKGVLRAVPEKTLRSDKSIKISPGNIDKEHMLAKLELVLNEHLNRDEVLSALPAGKFKVTEK